MVSHPTQSQAEPRSLSVCDAANHGSDHLSEASLIYMALGMPSDYGKTHHGCRDDEPVDCRALVEGDQTALERRYGLTPPRARRLWAIGQLVQRCQRPTTMSRTAIHRPEHVAELMQPLLSLMEVESFWALALDARRRLIGKPIQISLGDVDGTDAGPRAFLRPVIRRGAVSAVAVHNHPTGCCEPSAADIAVTRRLVAAGRAVDISLEDHVIVSSGGWCSLRRDQPDCFCRTLTDL